MKTMGRPVKKPGYDREAEINTLINRAVDLADDPFNDEFERDESLPTLSEIADAMDLNKKTFSFLCLRIC